jgi:hypothetical protein
MKKSQEHIQLTFSCQEDLDAMSETEKGKFCSTCKREVIDFTKMSYSEIQKARGSESKTCGIFLAEQLDPSLHPVEMPKVRSYAFLSSVLLALNFGSVSAQSTVDPKVEQSQGTSNAPNLTPEEAKEKSESSQHISMSKAAPTESDSPSSSPTTVRAKAKRAKKWYWSKRFPFLHKKYKRRYAGYFY